MTMTAMRDLLAGEGVWCVAATVQLHKGELTHFQKQRNGQLMISVVTNQHAVPFWATYKGGDILGRGIWMIPGIGTEVMLCFDQGDFEGDAFIVSMFGSAPDEAVAENITLLIDDTVEIRSLSGTAQGLLTVADGNALKSAISGAAVTANDGGLALKTNILTALDDWPTGTNVLKGE